MLCMHQYMYMQILHVHIYSVYVYTHKYYEYVFVGGSPYAITSILDTMQIMKAPVSTVSLGYCAGNSVLVMVTKLPISLIYLCIINMHL